MSQEFQPSVDAAKNALGNNVQIERRMHPSGAKGASVSLEECAKRIREGRLDPRIRAWAGKVLIAAGKPQDVIQQAQAILDAVRTRTMYAPDPVASEYMVAAKNTLCLDEQGLCISVADCDDLVVALGSALMSVGIPIKIIGQSFDNSVIPTHVMLAIETKLGWKKIDPSSSTFTVGAYYPATHEKWVDPLDTMVSIHDGTMSGDFVGIGQTPIGLGEPTITQDIYNYVIGQLESALLTLDRSVNKLGSSLNEIEKTRKLLSPNQLFDSEPNFQIKDVVTFPTNGMWTKSMATISVQIWDIGVTLSKAGHEALNGIRKLSLDKDSNEIYIETVRTDPWRIQTIVEGVIDDIVGFFSSSGELISGFTTKEGRSLTKEEISSQLRRSGQVQGIPTGVGAAPIIIAGAVVAVTAIAGLTIYYSIAKQAETAAIAATEASNKAVMDCVISGRCSSSEAKDILATLNKGRVEQARAQAALNKTDPFSKALENIGSILMWATIGGIALAGVYYGAPLIKDVVEDFRS